MDLSKELNSAVEAIRAADGIIIMTGAGMGVDSGMPDFRGGAGIWTTVHEQTHQKDMSFLEICDPRTLHEEYEMVMGLYATALNSFRASTPHHGFNMLHDIANQASKGGWVYTSNVDTHHQKAGWDNDRIVECHGTSAYMQCETPCGNAVWSSDDWYPEVDSNTGLLASEPPKCIICGGHARPNVMMFSDFQFNDTIVDKQLSKFIPWYGELQNPLVIEVGAGIAVQTIRYMASQLASRIIRVNPTHSAVYGKDDISIPLAALEGITAIYEEFNK